MNVTTPDKGKAPRGSTKVPNAPKTPTRTFRCPTDIWEAAKAQAAEDGVTVTDVLISALLNYIED